MLDFLSSIPFLGTALTYVLPFLVLLTLVVGVHEYGHYIVARWCKVHSEVFSIGFGRELFGWTDGRGTRWRISIVPLGGYVRFLGDLGVTSTASEPDAASTPGTLAAAALWQRSLIVFAGPAANFVFCAVLLFGLAFLQGHPVHDPVVHEVSDERGLAQLGLMQGDEIVEVNGKEVRLFREAREAIQASEGERIAFLVERDGQRVVTRGQYQLEPRVHGVVSGSAADEAGFLEGDLVLRVNGESTAFFSDIQRAVRSSEGGLTVFDVLRGQEELRLSAWPKWQEIEDPSSGQTFRAPLLGVTVNSVLPFSAGRRSAGFFDALAYGVSETWFILSFSTKAIGDLAFGETSLDEVGGPVAIANFTGAAAQQGLYEFIFTLALISASIGLFNLFPIPMLDGGHLLFFAIEAIRGKPLGQQVTGIVSLVGFLLLISLMLLVTFNDIVNL